MGKTQEETMNNPFIPKDSELHALTRAEEENCYKDMKAKALEACQLPIKDFVTCSKEHNVTVMWTCRTKLKAMNNCLNERYAAILNCLALYIYWLEIELHKKN
ncbi:hypothetical protein HMPREF1544_04354 [Mucor circinelloides 1006PhL]|uniref:COX assembly mitochondrial protein n=1 Tax=Mucor circinelloides f. circinelloides (strain 1006PhL) TaxID=1220926 RepID=S2K9A6_MUCC1|nr:hypothetical protein HMPREF1544_04354 [Mucor circinelloides 1006PhL]